MYMYPSDGGPIQRPRGRQCKDYEYFRFPGGILQKPSLFPRSRGQKVASQNIRAREEPTNGKGKNYVMFMAFTY